MTTPKKARSIIWRCARGHETELTVGPDEVVPETRLAAIRHSFSAGCDRRLRGGAVCGADVKQFGQ